MGNGPFDTDSVTESFPFTSAPRQDEELEHEEVTYSEPFTNTVTWQNYRAKTTTTAYRFRLLFLTKAAAEQVVDLLEAHYAALGAVYDPPRSLASIIPTLGYDGLAYDIVVNYSNSLAEIVGVTEE